MTHKVLAKKIINLHQFKLFLVKKEKEREDLEREKA
jgi:hypothetical protein